MQTRLKMIRRARGLTQEQMAALLSLHRSSYSLIESGRRGMSAQAASQIARILQVSTDYLLCQSELADGSRPLNREEENVLLQYRCSGPERRKLISSLVRELSDYEGEDSVTYEVITLGGVEQSRKEIGRKTVSEPVTEVIAEGTAVSYNGVKYSKVIRVVATGYTHTGNRTATGTWPHRGTMAVDRHVISMGTYGYVPGYGSVHAEDTGGAIKGNRIDLFFNSRGEAVRWGRRTVDLYIK